MAGFKPGSSDIGSDWSANCATTNVLFNYFQALIFFSFSKSYFDRKLFCYWASKKLSEFIVTKLGDFLLFGRHFRPFKILFDKMSPKFRYILGNFRYRFTFCYFGQCVWNEGYICLNNLVTLSDSKKLP